MPLEIRNKIWKRVLGDRLIHLQYPGIKRARKVDEERRSCIHIVCKHDRPEHEMTDKEIDWREPHQSCDHDLSHKRGYRDTQIGNKISVREPDPPVSVHLTVLRVCRQIYNEANDVLWSTNTFSFNEADPTFVDFMESRTTHQKQTLRKLRLQMDWVYGDEKGWNRIFGVKRLRSLTGIRSLRLQINHSMEAALYHEAKVGGDELAFFQPHQHEFVLKMATIPLTDVEVFVSDYPTLISDYPYSDSDSDEPPRALGDLWTAEDRTEYADEIRRILLDPKSAEKHAQFQETLQKCRQVVRDVRKEQKASRDAVFAEKSAKAQEYLRIQAPELLDDSEP